MRVLQVLLVGGVFAASACGRSSEHAPAAPTPPAASTAACLPNVEPYGTYFQEGGGSAKIKLTTSVPCAWHLTAPEWLAVGPRSGFGDTQLTLIVPPFSGTRSGTINIITPNRNVGLGVGQGEPITLSALCYSGRPGTRNLLGCYVEVRILPGVKTGVMRLSADLRAFGGSEREFPQSCQGCGGYDLGVTVPAGFPPGPVIVPFRFEDQEGHVATTTGTFTVLQ